MLEFWDGIPRSRHTWNEGLDGYPWVYPWVTYHNTPGTIPKWRPEGMDILWYFSLDVTARYGWIWMLVVGNFRKSLLFKCLRVQFCDRPWDCLPGWYCIKSSQKIILGIISSGTQNLSYEPAKHSSLFGSNWLRFEKFHESCEIVMTWKLHETSSACQEDTRNDRITIVHNDCSSCSSQDTSWMHGQTDECLWSFRLQVPESKRSINQWPSLKLSTSQVHSKY